MGGPNPFRRLRRTRNMDPARAELRVVADPTTAPATDELMQRVARGDRAAFARLYDEVMPLVYGIARRVVRDPAQAEEVAQEAMIDVWRTAVRFSAERGSARTFVATIAHRRAVDRVRSVEASRRRDTADARLADPPPAVVDEPEPAAIDSLERHQVREALAALTDTQREAIVLAYYDGRTHAEVAALLDVPLGTVKTRIRDGLIRLRDTMGVTA